MMIVMIIHVPSDDPVSPVTDAEKQLLEAAKTGDLDTVKVFTLFCEIILKLKKQNKFLLIVQVMANYIKLIRC